MRLVSGNFTCSHKPCPDGTTCFDLSGNTSHCDTPSKYKNDVGMFVCTYVTWSYRYADTLYQCLLMLGNYVSGYVSMVKIRK